MVISYPNGQKYTPHQPATPKKPHTNVIYGNRGMTLETSINEANQYYLTHQQAVIHKKPIPIQIVNVDYPKRSAAVIREAYFKVASTTDYNGVYRGKYVDFEAKETTSKTAFPLKNFHEHQITHLKACQKAGGVCFTLVSFKHLKEVYLMPAALLFAYWDHQNNARKSIPYQVIKDQGKLILHNHMGILDYLPAVDWLIKQLSH